MKRILAWKLYLWLNILIELFYFRVCPLNWSLSLIFTAQIVINSVKNIVYAFIVNIRNRSECKIFSLRFFLPRICIVIFLFMPWKFSRRILLVAHFLISSFRFDIHCFWKVFLRLFTSWGNKNCGNKSCLVSSQSNCTIY